MAPETEPARVAQTQAPAPPVPSPGSTMPVTSPLGGRLASSAVQLLGIPSLRQVDQTVPDDCTGLVRTVYESAGINLMTGEAQRGDNGVTAIYRTALSRGAVHQRLPKPGDLVFFRETYDRNRDGRRNDGLTHIGVVEDVEPGGLVTFVHRGSKGVARARMYLHQPATYRHPGTGEVLNDYIRRASRSHRAYLTGELFAGFASPEPLAQPLGIASLR